MIFVWLLPLLSWSIGISVTASTLSMMVLSIDRYLVVRHPTFISKYDRTFVHSIHVSFVWIVALIISLPIIFVRTVRRIEIYGISISFCIESWDSTSQRRLVSALNFTIVYLLVSSLFLSPRPQRQQHLDHSLYACM